MNTRPSGLPSRLYTVYLFLVLFPYRVTCPASPNTWNFCFCPRGLTFSRLSSSSMEWLPLPKKLVPRDAGGTLLPTPSFESGGIIHSQSLTGHYKPTRNGQSQACCCSAAVTQRHKRRWEWEAATDGAPFCPSLTCLVSVDRGPSAVH